MTGWLPLALALNVCATALLVASVVILWRGKLWHAKSRFRQTPAPITGPILTNAAYARLRDTLKPLDQVQDRRIRRVVHEVLQESGPWRSP